MITYVYIHSIASPAPFNGGSNYVLPVDTNASSFLLYVSLKLRHEKFSDAISNDGAFCYKQQP